jgi:FdrA protein
VKRVLVEPNRYFDSVFLMRIGTELEGLEGVMQAVVAMGTPANVENLARVGFAADATASVGPTDLLIAVEADSEAVLPVVHERLEKLLSGSASADSGSSEDARPASLDEAVDQDPNLNLAVVSVPGSYAAREAQRALHRGLHVLLFSDNVAVEDEIALKDEAARRGLLLMGPDCGTAILNGKPLGFANVVRRGRIGIVGASGTGIQEVSCLIDRFGSGVSQAIGTGGRDLSHDVAARSTLAGIDALAADEATDVLVVVSKAPAPEVGEAVIKRLKTAGKTSVVHFVTAPPRTPEGNIVFAETLDAAARAACRSAGHATPDEPALLDTSGLPSLPTGQRSIRGFFCGGTLCQEAWGLLRSSGLHVLSNVASDAALKIEAGQPANGHVLWDLGDDAFTVGRPHPMIEPELRDDHVAETVDDPSVGIVLVDCVLGYGAHQDPAGGLASAVERMRERARALGRTAPIVVASITGTEGDPQGFHAQRQTLEEAGVIVAESNAAAAQTAARLTEPEGGDR